ncbi:MAG: stress response translation initiation inhibitor YciH [Nanohaloarchaea archaeon SW_10_44_10]|nr:MAG: stress response translation initiation inhibitor YciH [Nanohaloarchaea archaeon SW_10_44_10]
MSENCSKCGMPEDLCVCDDIARDEQKITVKIDTRSFGKEMTVIEGLSDEVDLDELSSTLKTKLACGGTAKNGQIQLQGDHTHRITDVLEEEGFSRNQIEVQN